MAEKIVIDSGLKEFELYFKDRDITSIIRFNPSDTGLAARFMEMKNDVGKNLDKIKNVEVDAEGKPTDISYINTLNEVNQVIYDEIDYAFGNKISDVVFQFCNPLAAVNGKYFIIIFFEAITPVIEKCVRKESIAIKKHLDKYNK